MSNKGILALVVLLIAGAILSGSFYAVDQREKALVFRLGKIVQADIKPGLHLKTPFVENVRLYDARMQTMDAAPQPYLTIQKKNLIVDSFVKWRIRDAARYYVTVGGLKSLAEARLGQRVNDSLRSEFGKRTVKEVISGDRAKIMDEVRQSMDEEAQGMGIEVVDVRLKRVDLDPDVSERVYSRMEAERTRVAKELRAQGAEAAERIQADADRQRTILLANAHRDAEKLRGDGDAQATAIYAAAYDKDQEFFRLYRSLEAYRVALADPSNLLVVAPDSEFFRYFNSSKPANKTPSAINGAAAPAGN